MFEGEVIVKKLLFGAVTLLFSATAAYAGAPEAVSAVARACGLPCCW